MYLIEVPVIVNTFCLRKIFSTKIHQPFHKSQINRVLSGEIFLERKSRTEPCIWYYLRFDLYIFERFYFIIRQRWRQNECDWIVEYLYAETSLSKGCLTTTSLNICGSLVKLLSDTSVFGVRNWTSLKLIYNNSNFNKPRWILYLTCSNFPSAFDGSYRKII